MISDWSWNCKGGLDHCGMAMKLQGKAMSLSGGPGTERCGYFIF